MKMFWFKLYQTVLEYQSIIKEKKHSDTITRTNTHKQKPIQTSHYKYLIYLWNKQINNQIYSNFNQIKLIQRAVMKSQT